MLFKKIFTYILAITLFIVPLTGSNYAMAIDYDFYSSNDILFYDGGSTCSDNSANSDASQTENLQNILKYFTGKGLSLAVAAGIAGNFSAESAYLPARIQGSGTILAPTGYVPVDGVGFGLAQWTSSGRQSNLVTFAKDRNADIRGLNIQLDFTWQELTTSYPTLLSSLEAITSTATFGTDGATSASMAAAIMFHGMTTGNIQAEYDNDSVAKEFLDITQIGGFESSASLSQTVVDNRGRKAEEIFSTYKSTIPDGTGVTDTARSDAGFANYTPASDCEETASSTTGNYSSIPDNVTKKGNGWTLTNGQDYSNIPCEGATDPSVDHGIYVMATKNITIRKCAILGKEVASIIYARLKALIDAAAKDGITFNNLSSGLRTYEAQKRLHDARVKYETCLADAKTDSQLSACEEIYAAPAAAPGTSNHETGIAVDFRGIDQYYTNNTNNSAYKWLRNNASKYGFFQLNIECWHWSPIDDGYDINSQDPPL